MSEFDITPSTSNPAFAYVKPTDQKWKNFPVCYLPEEFIRPLSKIKRLQLFDDDIILTGYPRSGTTIIAEMIWLLANNFDFDKATSLITDDRVVGLEFDDSTQMLQKGKVMNTIENLSRPRTLKTHLPVQFLPDEVWVKKPKMIYVSRDPRDVAISLYHYMTHFDNVPINSYLETFLKGDQHWCPYREHRLNYLHIPDYPNILYLTYESITSDIDATINKVADFLGTKVSDENFMKLKDYLRFDKMKTNNACNNSLYFEKLNQLMKQKPNTDDFIRRGKINGYIDEMPEEFIQKFNKWIEEESSLPIGWIEGLPIRE